MKSTKRGKEGKLISAAVAASSPTGPSSSSSGHGSDGGSYSSTTTISSSSSSNKSSTGPASRLMEKSEARRVRETGDWSSNSKLSSIHNGYWEDPFFRFFNPNDPAKVRRTSLICRGYYVRFRVCDYFLRNLIRKIGKPVQIVSLGCGMDTCYFRILPELEMMISKFFEVDFKSVVKAKMSVITHNQVLRVMAEEKLKLLACDLRFIVSLHDTLKENGFDFNLPTIFYSECVVNYLGPLETTNILEWITTNVPNSIWLAYEQCNALDGFGQIMLSHFLKNGCPLLSLISAHSQKDQEIQLKKAGFKVAQVINAWDAFIKIGNDDSPHFPVLKNTDHQFDEYEQLIATSLHYSVRVALNGNLCEINNITDLLDKFHMHLVPALRQPGISHQHIKYSTTLTLETVQGIYLPTLTGHETIVINTKPNTLLTLGGCGENAVRMKHLIRSRIQFEDPSKQKQQVQDGDDPFDEEDTQSVSTNTTEVDVSGSVGALTVKSKILLENADHYERIHACAVFVPAFVKTNENHDSVLIFGGRKSPKTPCSNDLIELNVNKIDSKVNIASVIVSSKFDGSCPKSRWRHDMSLCSRNKIPHVLLFGGMSPEGVLGDCWWYNVDEFAWSEISSKTPVSSRESYPWPGPRHSHTLTSDVDGSVVYMVGGICENDTTLCNDAFWYFDSETEKWTNLEDWDAFARRVGHSTLKSKNLLIIVGGYGADSSYGFDFLAAICDLECSTVNIVTQTLPLNDIYLPFGFTASLLHDENTNKEKIVVFGGGGNCFSFGTHYNQVCYVFTINH